MDKRLQVVPGGTSGMGLATAVALGKFGPVLVGGRNEKRLETALQTLKEAGVEAYGQAGGHLRQGVREGLCGVCCQHRAHRQCG
ncbi:MAG: hypothetical protein IKO22_02900 [Oscillospiraceae bacterium]|nr:hypothetical protein [Oscillospiraceae bacterium]